MVAMARRGGGVGETQQGEEGLETTTAHLFDSYAGHGRPKTFAEKTRESRIEKAKTKAREESNSLSGKPADDTRQRTPPRSTSHPMLQQTPGPKRHGRKELVQWLNATLALELQAVEDTRNGAVACLLLDRARPGSIDLSRVDWAADAHAPVLRNYKLLQAGLARARVDRPVDVDGLARGTHRACLEFMQWFKRFSDATPCLDAYDPTEARRRCKSGAPAPPRPRAPRSTPPPPPPPPKKSADLEAVEAERDLYVTKLRDVERRVQTRPADESAAELALAITRILYDNGSPAAPPVTPTPRD